MTRPADDVADAIVLGGGPAGGAVARMLALWGRHVILLPGARTGRPRRAESLPPSCRKLLGVLGILERVEGAGFLPTRGNAAAWGEEELRSFDFAGGSGYQVERERFDALVVAAAAEAGARVREGAAATEVNRGSDGIALVAWRTRSGGGAARARWILDCTGRAGLLARRHRVPGSGPATVALCAAWSGAAGGAAHDPTHTLVESYADGWAWSVPVDPERRYVAVMLDPAVTRLRGRPLLDAYLAELGRTRHTARLLGGAERIGAPHACPATPYGARAYHDGDALLVGDAGSFLDPLSSFGVKKALASGWLAAVVANTALADPGRRAAALELYEERERLAQRRYAALAAGFYARAAEHHGTPFWRRRAGEPAAAGPFGPGHDAEPDDEAAGRIDRDPRVAAAFEFIRGSRRLTLRAGGTLRRVRKPVVRGSEVVLAEFLDAPLLPHPVRYVGSVELPRLLDLAPGHEHVPELFEAYASDGRAAPLPELLRALATLLGFGMLEAGGAP